MGKDGWWGKKGDWKGQAKWGKGAASDKGNWISQPEEPELKRQRMGKDGFKGKDLKGGLGMGNGMLEKPGFDVSMSKGCLMGKGPMPGPPVLPPGLPGLPPTLPPGLMPLTGPGPCMAKACQPPGKLVLLAPATKHITPVSSKGSNQNKKIAMEFVHATKDVQAQMLKDPAVARAILQTLAEAPGGSMQAMLGGSMPSVGSMGSMAPGVLPAFGMPAGDGASAPAWTGVITLARNMAKKTPFRAALVQGKVSDVEVVLRSAAANSSVADITHRVPFDDVAKKVASGSILSLVPNSIMEQASFDEYNKYFRSKSRAGVARLDGSLALYVMPCGEDIPALRDSLYALGPHIPRAGCLIGLIGPGTAAVNAPTAKPVKQEADREKPKAEPVVSGEPAPSGSAPEPPPAAQAEAEKEDGMSSKELMDLFSNPDLISLLSSQVGGGEA